MKYKIRFVGLVILLSLFTIVIFYLSYKQNRAREERLLKIENHQEELVECLKTVHEIDTKFALCIGDLYMRVLPDSLILANNLLEAINELQRFVSDSTWHWNLKTREWEK